MTIPTIDTVLAPAENIPSVADPTNFDAHGDEYLGTYLPQTFDALNTMVDEINTTTAAINEAADDIQSALDAATAIANASAFVPSATYTLNQAAISNVDSQTYRHITASSSLATDPKIDKTNWTKISAGGDASIASSTTQASPYAWTSTNYDMTVITAQDATVTFNADAGSPANGQTHVFRLTATGSNRTLTLTTGTSKSFKAKGVALPTEIVQDKELYIGCIYNSTDDRWDVVSVAQET